MFSWLLHTFVFSLLVCSGKGEKDILKFLKVQTATLSPTTVLETVVSTTPEDCATTCLSTETCKSFEITRNAPHTCYMNKEDTSERRMSYSTQYDFYQARQSKCPLNIVYGGYLLSHDDLGSNIATFTKCVNRCLKEPKCKSIELRSSDNRCDMSSASQLPLYVNKYGYDYVEVNRVHAMMTLKGKCQGSELVVVSAKSRPDEYESTPAGFIVLWSLKGRFSSQYLNIQPSHNDILGEVIRRSPSDKHFTNECNAKTPEGISSFYKKSVDSSSEMAYFELEYNPYVDIENMPKIPVRSQVDCSVECLRNDDCIAFNYYSGEQKTCQLKRRI